MITVTLSRQMFNLITMALHNEALNYKEWAYDNEDDAPLMEDYMSTAVQITEVELYLYEQKLAQVKGESNDQDGT